MSWVQLVPNKQDHLSSELNQFGVKSYRQGETLLPTRTGNNACELNKTHIVSCSGCMCPMTATQILLPEVLTMGRPSQVRSGMLTFRRFMFLTLYISPKLHCPKRAGR